MNGMPPLPDGLSSSPLAREDLRAAFELYAADERATLGTTVIEIEDVESDWTRESFDLSTDSIGVFEGERLVGAAEVFKARRADGAVATDRYGRGIGSWLVAWTEQCARKGGGTLVGQTKFAGSPAERLLRARGYREGWTSWVLQVPEGAPILPQPLPHGFSLRDVRLGEDDRAAYELIENAFNEWPDREPSAFADWAPRVIGRSGFEPWQLRLAVDPSGEPVGVAFTIIDASGCAYVDQLAVRADHRGRGLARSLLADAFARARERGAQRSELSTDSRTGALGVYQRIGMVVTQTWRHWLTDV